MFQVQKTFTCRNEGQSFTVRQLQNPKLWNLTPPCTAQTAGHLGARQVHLFQLFPLKERRNVTTHIGTSKVNLLEVLAFQSHP